MERLYDMKGATSRIVPDIERFTEELRRGVQPNTVKVYSVGINHFNFIIIYENNPCIGELYSLQYDGIEAQYQFRGHVNLPLNNNF